jgi:hypothetical protein
MGDMPYILDVQPVPDSWYDNAKNDPEEIPEEYGKNMENLTVCSDKTKLVSTGKTFCSTYTKMEFKDDDYIELPEAYKELLTLAVTVGLLSEDADSDPKQLANYSAQLTSMEDLVGATNVTTRRLTREPDGNCLDSLRTGAFIRRRFGR